MYRWGRTVEVAAGPRLLGTSLVGPMGKLRMSIEPFLPAAGPPDESVEAFLVRRLGPEAGHLLAGLMAAGVHAGDPERLSVAAAFPKLAGLEARQGSLIRGMLAGRRAQRGSPGTRTHVVAGGTAEIAHSVAASLGARWHSSWPVDRLEAGERGWRVIGPETLQADRVVAAIPPRSLAAIYSGIEGAEAEWAPVAVVWLGLDAAVPAGMGCLVAADEGFITLGFLYESSYAPERAPRGKGLVKAVVGGARKPGAVDLPDDRLVDRVSDELGRVLDRAPNVEMAYVMRHRPGIPQYTAARTAMVRDLRRRLPPGLSVAGWAYDGVGVSQLAAAADQLAGSSTHPWAR